MSINLLPNPCAATCDGHAWYHTGHDYYLESKFDYSPLYLGSNEACWLCRATDKHSEELHEHMIFDEVSDAECIDLYADTHKHMI